MHPPEPGERGIYFVAELGRTRMHPLLGWDQGRFPIREGQDPVVTTADGEPVLAVDPAAEGAETGPSRGVARGVRTGDGRARGLAPEAFKSRIRARVSEGAEARLTAAGFAAALLVPAGAALLPRRPRPGAFVS